MEIREDVVVKNIVDLNNNCLGKKFIREKIRSMVHDIRASHCKGSHDAFDKMISLRKLINFTCDRVVVDSVRVTKSECKFIINAEHEISFI